MGGGGGGVVRWARRVEADGEGRDDDMFLFICRLVDYPLIRNMSSFWQGNLIRDLADARLKYPLR